MAEKKRPGKAEQREITFNKFVVIARQVFAQQGYSGAATEEIVQLAGVTRGALYHHFGSKEGLFQAVVEEVQKEIAIQVLQATQEADDPWTRLLAGCRAYLTACLAPEFHRILLIDAPAVLGWEQWRELDSQYGTRLLRESLVLLTRQKAIRPLSIDALTHLINGAITEATLWMAQQPEPANALEEVMTGLTALLSGLRLPPR